jgi:hypothetical protein
VTARPDFYDALPTFDRFGEVGRAANYHPLPDDWIVGVDGASCPYVFGGDGATFALWPGAAAAAADALARTSRWVADDLGLDLRVGLVPVAAARTAGHDVAVARFRSAPGVAYAMFSGGGAAWAMDELKAGRHGIATAPPGARPDLTGLSCRFNPMRARNGRILSVIVQPRAGVALAAVEPVLGRVIARAEALARQGDPVPVEGPDFDWPPRGLELEVRATRRSSEAIGLRRLRLRGLTLTVWLVDRLARPLRARNPISQYRRAVARNADWRKYDDGLRLTLDCDAATHAAIEADLSEAAAQGLIDYGLHAQDEALMTCLVPSILRDDHAHFIDGADGGYARAAAQLKARASAA